MQRHNQGQQRRGTFQTAQGDVDLKGFRRIFFDTTYTRAQVGSVGITRTVRRLQEELQEILPSRVPLQSVAFHSSGYRLVETEAPKSSTRTQEVRDSQAARLLRWISESFVRRLAFIWAPLPLLYWTWRVQSAWTFDALTRNAKSIAFEKGDLLLLCDASWCCNAWEAAQLARSQGAKVALLVYDLIPVVQPEFSSALTTKIFERWLRQMSDRSDAIMCISEATETDLRAYAAKKGITLPPTDHFRLGCDVAHKRAEKAIRTQITRFAASEAPCFASVGTIEPRKNYGMLLTAFEQLWARGNNIRLLILGRPNPDCHELLTRMKRHPEQGNRLLTIFDGTDGELEYAYSSCRALILPSLAEGFGLPLVEARSRGCTVIANDLPSFVELADEGVLFYRKNSIKELNALLINNADLEKQNVQKPLPPFTWRDSAIIFIKKTIFLLKHDSISLKD